MHNYPLISETINEAFFSTVISSANFVIKSAYFKFTFIRCFLWGIGVIWLIEFISSCATLNVFGAIMYMIFILLCPYFMRLGSNQFNERMLKYKKVLMKAMETQTRVVLSNTGIVVEPGDRCMWLDFHTGNYAPPSVQVNYFGNAGVVYPGAPIDFRQS